MVEPVTTHKLSMDISQDITLMEKLVAIQSTMAIINISNGANNYFRKKPSSVVV